MRMYPEIFNFVKNILLGVIGLLCPWINCLEHLPSPSPPQLPPPITTVELSGGVAAAVPTAEQALPPAAPTPTDYHNRKLREWPFLVIGVCFAAAGLGLQAIQTFETVPLTFHCFCMAIQFSFSALTVSVYIRARCPLASLVMEHAAIFFGTTAFTVSIAMNLPTSFMVISVAVYLISILVIIFVNLSGRAT